MLTLPWLMLGTLLLAVVIGYPKDTFAAAEQRLQDITRLGFTPMAMVWRPEHPKAQQWAPGPAWRTFQRRWARPALIHARVLREGQP